MENNIIQEAVMLSQGMNYMPMMKRYRLPNQTKNASIYLVSNSYEYDIQMIREIPQPKIEYKNIIIPYKVIDRLNNRPFRYIMNQNEYMKRVVYLNSQKFVPRLNPIKYPYPDRIKENLYIPMSDILKKTKEYIYPMSVQFMKDNIFAIFNKVMGWFNYSDTRVLLIDTKRHPIYRNMTLETYKSDLINGLLAAYMLASVEQIPRMKWIFVFRGPDADYKFDLSTFRAEDRSRLRTMLEKIGTIGDKISEPVDDTAPVDRDEVEDTLDTAVDNIDSEETTETDGVETNVEIKNFQNNNYSSTEALKTTLNMVSAKYGIDPNQDKQQSEDKKLYNAKTIDITSQLVNRISKLDVGSGADVIKTYKTISSEITQHAGDNKVEDELLDNATKNIANETSPVDDKSVENTISSARELEIRKHVGQVKLNDVTFDTLTSVTDTPLPAKVIPLKITTTSKSALAGTSFTRVSQEYEDKLMDRDIVSTFMHLSALPDGFYVTNVEVTDISNATSLINNWKVTLKNKQNERQSVINIRVPKVINGKFYNKGTWYNIGKQDFPIPVLKIDKKKVICTSNYNKISVTRYDTRSLVHIGVFTKLMNSISNADGSNKYIKPGSSSGTNSRFVSTIEYDEYAKQWVSFHNKQADCMIVFDRQKCLKQYEFVAVNENEFCCGMINKVPIILNVETGMTRQNKTLTETMLETLDQELQSRYAKIKPGKLSMYSQIQIGETMPLGVCVAAWEGISSLIKKSNAKVQYVDKNFNDTKYIIIPFKDKSLAILNTIQNQLLFNGFFRINTKAFNISEFDIPIMNANSVYVEIFNQHFFKQFSQLTLFITYYNFFVDAITKDVCLHYNIPDDITGMLIYASNLLADNGFTTETNSTLYRIRSSEIIPAIIHYRLAFAISRYTNSLGSKSRGAKFIFNPNEVIDELIKVPTVSTLSALNPYVELHERENISRKGFRGVNDERTFTLNKRAYDQSMIGKMAISSPNNRGVGITRQLTADPKIESVRGYTSTKSVDDPFNDLQLASFSELCTPGTVSRDDAIRNAIATAQTSHIVQTRISQPALISNGVDEIVAASLSDEFAVMAKKDGQVLEIADDYMIVEYKDKTKQAIPVGDRQSFNSGSGFYVNNKLTPNFKPNEKFKENDILAYHAKFFTRDIDGTVRMNIGPLAKVAFMETYATYEDAGIMTANFSKKMATTVSMRQLTKIDATDDIDYVVEVGTEVEIGDPLIKFGLGDTGDKSVDNFLKAFQTTSTGIESFKRTVNAKHAGKVVDVRMYTCKSMDALSPSLYKLLSDHFKQNLKKRKILDKYDKSSSVYKMDTLFSLPTEPLKGNSIKDITADVIIEIYIEHEDEQSVGDKAVAYAAMKQITSEVIPEGLEPYTASNPDEEISMFVNSGSILKRMVPSAMIIAAGNKVLVELKKQMRKIWENG